MSISTWLPSTDCRWNTSPITISWGQLNNHFFCRAIQFQNNAVNSLRLSHVVSTWESLKTHQTFGNSLRVGSVDISPFGCHEVHFERSRRVTWQLLHIDWRGNSSCTCWRALFSKDLLSRTQEKTAIQWAVLQHRVLHHTGFLASVALQCNSLHHEPSSRL